MIDLGGEFRSVPLAHRALHDVQDGRPENSRAAIRAAIAAGYGIEIDLQLSSDGHAMVFHDYDLARLTGVKGPIQQRCAADLSAIGLLGGNEGIPSLAEVLDLVAGRVPLLIELKDQHGQMGPTDGALEDAVAADLAGYHGAVAVMSFNPHMVARLHERAPDIPRGLTTAGFRRIGWPLLKRAVRHHLRQIPDFDTVGASFISHDIKALDMPRVAELKARGIAILCWTVRGPKDERAARLVADNITFEGYRPAIAP